MQSCSCVYLLVECRISCGIKDDKYEMTVDCLRIEKTIGGTRRYVCLCSTLSHQQPAVEAQALMNISPAGPTEERCSLFSFSLTVYWSLKGAAVYLMEEMFDVSLIIESPPCFKHFKCVVCFMWHLKNTKHYIHHHQSCLLSYRRLLKHLKQSWYKYYKPRIGALL